MFSMTMHYQLVFVTGLNLATNLLDRGCRNGHKTRVRPRARRNRRYWISLTRVAVFLGETAAADRPFYPHERKLSHKSGYFRAHFAKESDKNCRSSG